MWFQGHICRFFACFLLFGTTTPRYAVSSVWGLSCRPIGAISLFQTSFFNPPIALGGSVFESAKKLCSAFGVILWWLLLYMEWVKNATIKSSIGAPEVVMHYVKHEWFFLKLAKFYGHVDYYDKTDQELDAGMWRYHANRMDARRSQFDVGTPMVIFPVYTVFWLSLTVFYSLQWVAYI